MNKRTQLLEWSAGDIAPQVPFSSEPAPFEVRVARVTTLTPRVKEFELCALHEAERLPLAGAGAHLRVKTGNGLWRAYSVVNPEDPERYLIAVQLRLGSTTGSQFMHDFVSEGDELTVDLPHNGFELATDASRSILIAGGIGITPLLAIGRRMKTLGLPFDMHYIGRSAADMAYLKQVQDEFGARAHLYFTDSEGLPSLTRLVGRYQDRSHLYLCGPDSLLQEARRASAAWPADSVHFERFINPPDSPSTIAQPAYEFEIELARSGRVLKVSPTETILDVLRGVGVDLPTVCRAGFCGTCVVPVLSGAVDHRDTVLTDEERKTRLQACCSRAPEGTRVVIDR